VKCPSCGSEIPDESRFCLSCGKDLVAPAQLPKDDGSEIFAMMCMGIAFMMFFFSMAPFFLGIWVAGVAMLGVGVVLMLAGYRMIRASRRDHVEIVHRKAVRIRCRYCGTLNKEQDDRCDSCGASL
jgi:uncharacterized OB-fold protein